VGADRVKLGQPVAMVTQEGEEVKVVTKGGLTVKCKKVVLAIPPSQIGREIYKTRFNSEM